MLRNKGRTLSFVIVCLILVIFSTEALAFHVTISSDWDLIINGNDLVGGAGSDTLTSIYESGSGDITLSLTDTSGVNWKVNLRRSDVNWPATFTLKSRRTSSGTGGTVNGGTAYNTITTTNQLFFTGKQNVIGVELQFRLEGVSFSLAPDTYVTTLTYTLVENN